MSRRAGVLLAALAALLALAPAAGAAPTPERVAKPDGPLGHEGRWLTDRHGRVVILHGVNMVSKRPPYVPAGTGFGPDDADFLRRHGFNTVRLGVIYSGVEPQPGNYDDAYLRRVGRTQRQLAHEGIFSQLDFHQDLYNERFGGEGWPDWATLDDGVPADPLTGFPGSYISSPGLNRAFDNFWENEAGPGGVTLQARYAGAWRHVARTFRDRPYVMGYDLLNEPWPGSGWAQCASNIGCPAFDTGPFTAFYERMITAIRRVDRRNLIWYEPNVIFNFGSDSSVDSLDDPRLGFSFHIYCLAPAVGVPGGGEACATAEELTWDNADKQASQTGSALLLSEFGATEDVVTIRRITDEADDRMVSWQWWHYCGCDDPTTQGPGDVQALVFDPTKAPRNRNVHQRKLRLLARPYPQVTAGTPVSFDFDRESRRFELVYATKRASGRGRFRRALTDVFIPRVQYRRGYKVRIRGAREIGRRFDQHLILRAKPGARRVSLVVTPRD